MLDIKSVKLRSEDEIISSWKNKEIVQVSILCATFNHMDFIKDAITGFLMQETDFAFEIVIHDDASTDQTADIVREFQSRYPRIIKAICQTENQHSKGGFKSSNYMMKVVEGQFMALCEGDDYWIDANKIQRQFDICKNDPDVSFIAHSALTLSCKTGEFKAVDVWGERDYICELSEILTGPKAYGQFSPTAAYFIKKDVYNHLPDWFINAPTGDFYLEVLSALRGKMVYLPEVMSVYRIENSNAWTGVMNKDVERRFKYFQKRLWALKKFKSMVKVEEKKHVDFVIAETYEGLLYDMGQVSLIEGIKYFFLSSFYARKIKYSTFKNFVVVSIPNPLLNKLRTLKSSLVKG